MINVSGQIAAVKTRFLLMGVTVVALMLGACATGSPYQPSNGRGDGYSEQKLERDKYRIVFKGNSLTDRVTVENYVLYRAAEVTVASGNDYFILLEDTADARRSFRTTGTSFGGAGFGRRGFFYGGFGRFNRFGRGGGFGGGFDTSTTRERVEYTIGAIIQVYKGAKPTDEPTAYDARSVIESLGPSIRYPES